MSTTTTKVTVQSTSWSPSPSEKYYICRGNHWWRVNPVTQQAELHCDAIDHVSSTQAIVSSIDGQNLGVVTWDSFEVVLVPMLLLFAAAAGTRIIVYAIKFI